MEVLERRDLLSLTIIHDGKEITNGSTDVVEVLANGSRGLDIEFVADVEVEVLKFEKPDGLYADSVERVFDAGESVQIRVGLSGWELAEQSYQFGLTYEDADGIHVVGFAVAASVVLEVECDHSADFDVDGDVDFADFVQLAKNVGREMAARADGDVDCDGTVGFADFIELAKQVDA